MSLQFVLLTLKYWSLLFRIFGYITIWSEKTHSIEADGYVTLSEARCSLTTTKCGKDSLTEISCDKVLDIGDPC